MMNLYQLKVKDWLLLAVLLTELIYFLMKNALDSLFLINFYNKNPFSKVWKEYQTEVDSFFNNKILQIPKIHLDIFNLIMIINDIYYLNCFNYIYSM